MTTRHPYPVVLTFAFAWLAISALSGAEPESPFALPPPDTPAPATETSLSSLQFAGVANVNGETSVYLRDSARGMARWFRVGRVIDGICAEQYDPEREAVCVRDGANVRWLQLPRQVIVAVPIARLPDGTVDWTYMKLSEKGKETEAMHLMQDIMFASMAAREEAGRKGPDAAMTTISPAR